MKQGKSASPTDVTAEIAKKILSGTKEDKQFFLSNGNSISNYYELYRALKEMDDNTFSRYVNTKENHFANWISGVFKDNTLSTKIKRFKTRQACALVVSQRIKDLNKIMNDSKGTTETSSAPTQLKNIVKNVEIKKPIKSLVKPIIKNVQKELKIETVQEKTVKTPSVEEVIEKKISLPPKPKEVKIDWVPTDKLQKLKHGPAQAQPNKNRLYSIGGSLFALLVLIGTLAGINMTQNNNITGAVVGSTTSSAGISGWIAFIIIIAIIVIADIAVRKEALREAELKQENWAGTDDTQSSNAFREMFEKENISEKELELADLIQKYK